jgi:SIT family siderophore-iron:H+ symporter-like MFS transporter
MTAAWENKGAQEASTAAPELPPGYTEANHATQLPPSDLDAREMSPGVRRIELINTQLGRYGRIAMFFGIWLISYVYGLDGGVRITYQVHTSAFHPKLVMISRLLILR